MSDKGRTLLDPLQQLLLIAGDERFVPSELAGRINTLNALLVDLGERMNEEMRAKWKDRIGEAVSDCDRNGYDLIADKQKICAAALWVLGGRFYEVVENDHVTAAAHYEEAANKMDFVPGDLFKELNMVLVGKVDWESNQHLAEKMLYFANVALGIKLRLPAVGLWDWAGDSYCRVDNRMGEAKRCYEHGLGILRSAEAEGARVELWETSLCHLKMSLANLLLARFDEWEKAKILYSDVAGAVFFNKEERRNEEYRGICSIIVPSNSTADAYFEKSDWALHVNMPAAQKYKDMLTKLKAELGQRALDLLRKEFEKSEEGFPVPETYYLVAFLGELYLALKEYEKCADIVGKGESFDDNFIEWAISDELIQHANWAFPFVVHTSNEYFAKGLLQRPDYKEFLEHQKKVEESHQRQELRQIRYQTDLERELPKMSGGVTVDKVQTGLVEKNPWLENALNLGSVVNAEILYEQLSKYNWGEVVMGYCNAVEEELKQFLYKEYLAYYAEKYNEGYEGESRRQREQGSVLYFIANVTTNTMKNQIWNQFVKTRYPEHGVFLSKELPQSLDKLTVLRNKAAHGKMVNPGDAENARKIVMGTSGKPGLLERLVAIHQSGGSGEAV